MGAGASAQVSAAVDASSVADLEAALESLPAQSRIKLSEAIAEAGRGTVASKSAHVMFMLLAFPTHINPILPFLQSLTAKNVKVTSCSTMDGNDALVEKIKKTGSQYIVLKKAEDANPVFDAWEGDQAFFVYLYRFMPDALAQAQFLQPTIIAYDPFLGWPSAIAKILKVSSVGVLTFSGPGACAKPIEAYEKDEAAEKVQAFLAWFRATYGVELLENGIWPRQFYSKSLNIVTCARALSVPATDEFQVKRFAGCLYDYVGPLVDPRKNSCDVGDFPLDKVKEAKNGGRSVILVALGTLVTGPHMWEKPWGDTVKVNCDGTTVKGKTMVESTGKEVCQFVFRTCMEAFGSRDDFFVVLTVGKAEYPLEGLGMETPANFLVAPFVPQLAVLPLCSAFVSHGGMGSINESVLNRVPLIIVPVMGDQPFNADCVAAAKVGVGFRYPFKTLNKDSLLSAAETLTSQSSSSAYKIALQATAANIEAGAGPDGAAKAILGID